MSQEVPDLLRSRARASPDSLALKVGPLKWSYQDLHERVASLSAVLLSRRVGKGTRVALLMHPSEGYVALLHAITRLGAVAVPLNHRQSAKELRGQLLDSAPTLVVHDASFERTAGRTDEARPPGRVLASELMEESESVRTPVAGGSTDISAPQAIVYTSGSSGTPKGVVLTVSNMVWNAVSVGIRVGASPADRWLLCMPLFHVGGYAIVFRSLVNGSGIVLHPRFEPEEVSTSLDAEGITLASFVPTMFAEVLIARRGRPFDPRLRAVFIGGGQTRPSLIEEIRRRHLPVLLTYGMTETCSQVAVSEGWDAAASPVYGPLFPSDLEVVRPGPRLEPADAGQVGEIAVKGPSVFQAYWRNPALTKARFKDGWFLTGDLGVHRPGGVALLGRNEEMIISGGEKVFPAEVEAALREHSAVKDAVVLGVKDAKWGERVVAVLETKPTTRRGSPSEEALTLFLKERVGSYKVPKEYHFMRQLPRTPTGKLRRAEVRRLIEEGGRRS